MSNIDRRILYLKTVPALGCMSRDTLRIILEQDDIYSGLLDGDMVPSADISTEPPLPEGVQLVEEGGTDNSYQLMMPDEIKDKFYGEYIAVNTIWKPEQLESIAAHMRWRSRPKPAAKGAEVPEVTEAMMKAAAAVIFPISQDYTNEFLRKAIQAALAAGKKGTT